MKSENINELAAALAKAQSEIRNAELDRANPFFKSRYSTLAAVWEACREPLTKNGLSVVQGVERGESGPFVSTMLLHSSGQFISSECPLIMGKMDMQSLGSAISYAQRYALKAAVGVCSSEDNEDDDGNKAKSEGHGGSFSAVKQDAEDLSGYTLGFGKYSGKTLGSIGVHDLDNYAQWLKKNQKPGEKESPALAAIEAFLKTREVRK